jgi:hypothetical protein
LIEFQILDADPAEESLSIAKKESGGPRKNQRATVDEPLAKNEETTKSV